MLCPLCNKEIKDDSKFCGKCGKKIPRCPTCGRVITKRSKFCTADGTPIPEDMLALLPVDTPAPAEVKAPAAKFCVRCGAACQDGGSLCANCRSQDVVPPSQAPKVPIVRERRFCVNCGKPCEDPAQKLCAGCSAAAMPPKRTPPEKKKKKKPFTIILIILLILLLLISLGVIGYVIWGGGDDAADAGKDDSHISSSQRDDDDEEEPTDGDEDPTDAVATEAPTEATEAPTEAPTEPPVITYEYRYEVIASDMSWEEAKLACEAKGGYLATITSAEEHAIISELATKSGLTYLWIGACLTSDTDEWSTTTWITGEEMTYTNWYPGEPSKFDNDGTREFSLCLWNAKYKGNSIGWTFNDQRSDLVGTLPTLSGKVGYICEYRIEVIE